MFASDIDFKKDLMAHNIFSTWQFIQNAKKNLDIASFAATTITNIISNMTNETVKWEQDLFRGFRDSGDKQVTHITTDNMPAYQVDIAGTNVSGYFLVDKLIKDFYQYIRNCFDSIGQIANSGLLANAGKEIDATDFTAMIKRFSQETYKTAFILTAAWFETTGMSAEFKYIDAINNRTKHTADISNKLSMGILGSSGGAEIGPFFRRNKQHEKRDLSAQLQATLDYTNNTFQDFLNAFCTEYPNDTFSGNRQHSISVHQQKMNDGIGSSFSYAYIPCVGSFATMSDEIRVLLVKEHDDDIIAHDCPFDVLLVTGNSNTDVVGRYVAQDKVGDDCLLRYRRFKKDTQTAAHMCHILEMTKGEPVFYHWNPFFSITVVSDDDSFLARSSMPF